MAERKPSPRIEPAHSILYDPASLARVEAIPDTDNLLQTAALSLKNPFNDRQREAFALSFTQRILLLWGPPGTGKTTVLAGIILGWLERASSTGEPVCIGVGASNYNAIDNVLVEVIELIERRIQQSGDFLLPVTVARVRSDHSHAPRDKRIIDVPRRSEAGSKLAQQLEAPESCLVVGGTWMQLGKLCQTVNEDKKPVSEWFDLFIIDEASQLEVAAAGAYFLLLKENANVVLAGDHKQLGPIYGFEMREPGEGLFDCIFAYMKEAHGIVPIALDQNYRMNDGLTGWPKKRFYHQGYHAFYPQRRLEIILPDYQGVAPVGWPAQLPWSNEYLRILNPELPVAVITYDAATYTLSNPFEAQMVAALSYLYRRILDEQGVKPSDKQFWQQHLGIVTPHRAQMSSIRNKLVETTGMSVNPPPFVDTVDRFQGLERDLMIASYTVADRDFVRAEEEFILNPRRFNVTLTRARSKFVMFISDAIIQHLPTDAEVARDAAHIQLFVEDYCSGVNERIELPFLDNGSVMNIPCRLKGVV